MNYFLRRKIFFVITFLFLQNIFLQNIFAGSFIKYDPFKLRVLLPISKNNFVGAIFSGQTQIFSFRPNAAEKVKELFREARENNLKISIDVELGQTKVESNQSNYQSITPGTIANDCNTVAQAIVISEEPLDGEWLCLPYTAIEFDRPTFGSRKIVYRLDDKNYAIAMPNEIHESRRQFISGKISEAKRRKKEISINLTNLSSVKRTINSHTSFLVKIEE